MLSLARCRNRKRLFRMLYLIYFTVLHILSVIADKITILHFMVTESEFRSIFSEHFSVDMTSIFAYNEGGR